MALPLLSLRICDSEPPPGKARRPRSTRSTDVRRSRTGTFFVPGISGQLPVSAADRMLTLKKWFDLKEDGTAKHVDVQPRLDEFGFNELPGRKTKHWAKELPNNAMCNIMTWTMLEISKARFDKYKDMGIETSLALRQAARANGLPVDYKANANDSVNPLIASFMGLKRRSEQLKTLERESLRQALGVRRSIGEDDSVLVNDADGDTYDADIVADVIKRAVTVGSAVTGSFWWGDQSTPYQDTPSPFGNPETDMFGGTPADGYAPDAANDASVADASGGGYDAGGESGKEYKDDEFPAWMLEDPPKLPDRDLTVEESDKLGRLDLRRRNKIYADKTENDRLYEEQRRRYVEIEKRRLDRLEEDEDDNKKLREKQVYRDRMQLEFDIRRLEEEERKREAEEKEEDEGPLPTWDPYKVGQQIVKVLDDIEKNYSGNDELKDFIYLDIVSFLGDPVASMSDYRNYAFMGPSGVGKTTWARLMGKMYSAIGMYLYGVVAETKASDYISNYLGQTGSKTAATLNQNLENIILIDEAYSMAKGGNKDYGSDAITAIVDWMDKNLGCYMLIIAGYERDIKEDFLALNEGLDRRFNNKFVFLEYTGTQMADILKKILSKSNMDKKWDPRTWAKVAELIDKSKASHDYVETYQEKRNTHLANVALLGRGFEPMNKDASRWAKFYDVLFSKQAGSMTLIAAKAKKYMLVPTKRPPVGAEYKYDSDMMQVLLSFLPRENQKEISDKSSDTYRFLSLSFEPPPRAGPKEKDPTSVAPIDNSSQPTDDL